MSSFFTRELKDVKTIEGNACRDTIKGYIRQYIGYKNNDIPGLIVNWCILYYHINKLATEYRVPRNFKLLDELEMCEKGKYHNVQKYGHDCNWVNLGLDGIDPTFTHWNGSLIPVPGGYLGDRIYTLKIEATPNYPQEPPIIKFVQKVAMKCVDDNGYVQFDKMQTNFKWTEEKCLFEAVLAIRDEIGTREAERSCAKIPNGTKY